jgi:hypothetical protein
MATPKVIDFPQGIEMPPQSASRIRAGVYRISPDIARRWLEANRRNRPVNRRAVAQYDRDMKRSVDDPDAWLVTPDAIGWDTDANLVNGQHRLEAIVLSGVAVDCLVVFGLSPKAFNVIDMGNKRNASQVLVMKGERYTPHLGAALALLWRYENAAIFRKDVNPTIVDRVRVLDDNPDIRDSVEHSVNAGKLRFYAGSTAVASLVHLMGTRKHGRAKTDLFFDQLGRGVGLQATDPAYHLRERLVMNRELQTRLNQKEVLAVWLPAWNAYARGETMRKLVPLEWTEETMKSLEVA